MTRITCISLLFSLLIIIYNNLRKFCNPAEYHLNSNILQVNTATSAAVNSKEMTRDSNSPDALLKSFSFVSCWVRKTFVDLSKPCFWQILNYFVLLTNLAYVIQLRSRGCCSPLSTLRSHIHALGHH